MWRARHRGQGGRWWSRGGSTATASTASPGRRAGTRRSGAECLQHVRARLCRTGDGMIPSGISDGDIACKDRDLGVEIKEARLEHWQLGVGPVLGDCCDDVLVASARRNRRNRNRCGLSGLGDPVFTCMLIEYREQSQRD
jgi:hypothetical protein